LVIDAGRPMDPAARGVARISRWGIDEVLRIPGQERVVAMVTPHHGDLG
jgi:hypothetical protein